MTIYKLRKKPVEIFAVQWTGGNSAEVYDFTENQFRLTDKIPGSDITAEVYDKLHDTWVGVRTDQWVIQGVKGEFYPCDQAVLTETYEEVVSG